MPILLVAQHTIDMTFNVACTQHGHMYEDIKPPICWRSYSKTMGHNSRASVKTVTDVGKSCSELHHSFRQQVIRTG